MSLKDIVVNILFCKNVNLLKKTKVKWRTGFLATAPKTVRPRVSSIFVMFDAVAKFEK